MATFNVHIRYLFKLLQALISEFFKNIGTQSVQEFFFVIAFVELFTVMI